MQIYIKIYARNITEYEGIIKAEWMPYSILVYSDVRTMISDLKEIFYSVYLDLFSVLKFKLLL